MRLRQWGIAAAALTVIVGSFLLMNILSSRKKSPEKQPQQASTVSVKVETVRYSEVIAGLTASGRVSSQAEVDLSSEVQGRLIPGDLTFRKGQSFSKGQVLIRVFEEDVEYALRSRKSGFLTSLANLLPDLRVDFPSAYPSWLSFFNRIKIDQEFPPMPDLAEEKLRIFLSSRGILPEYYAI